MRATYDLYVLMWDVADTIDKTFERPYLWQKFNWLAANHNSEIFLVARQNEFGPQYVYD